MHVACRAGSNPDVPWSGVGMGRAIFPAYKSSTARANSLASLALNVIVPEVVPEADSEASFLTRSESRSALSTASEQERERLGGEPQDGLAAEPVRQEDRMVEQEQQQPQPQLPRQSQRSQQQHMQQQQAGLSQFQLARQALRKQQLADAPAQVCCRLLMPPVLSNSGADAYKCSCCAILQASQSHRHWRLPIIGGQFDAVAACTI